MTQRLGKTNFKSDGAVCRKARQVKVKQEWLKSEDVPFKLSRERMKQDSIRYDTRVKHRPRCDTMKKDTPQALALQHLFLLLSWTS